MTDRTVDYDRVAPHYDRRYALEHYAELERAVRKFADGARALEVGCGTGRWLARLTEAGGQVSGIDPSEQMLARARERVPGADLRLGRAEALPWDDASFDRVLCVNAMHHFDDARASVREARRVLRPGGGVLVAGLDPHRGADRWWIYDWFEGALERDRDRYPPATTIRTWMAEAGLRDVETVEAQHLPLTSRAADVLDTDLVARHSTSQLLLLTDAEYDAGIAAIRAALRDDPDLELRVDLRLWATTGWV